MSIKCGISGNHIEVTGFLNQQTRFRSQDRKFMFKHKLSISSWNLVLLTCSPIDTTVMVSGKCINIGEQVMVVFLTRQVTIAIV